MQQVLGAHETIQFPEFGLETMVAKIDTGADSGAFHCTKIREDTAAGKKVLHFSPFDHPERVKTTDKFRTRHVRSSNGDSEKRYYVDTVIRLKGKDYPIHLSLADRTKMSSPVLIGKRFLRQHGFVVDVSRNNK